MSRVFSWSDRLRVQTYAFDGAEADHQQGGVRVPLTHQCESVAPNGLPTDTLCLIPETALGKKNNDPQQR
jgi:hypothetical protein